jgi:hypothetical protein
MRTLIGVGVALVVAAGAVVGWRWLRSAGYLG